METVKTLENGTTVHLTNCTVTFDKGRREKNKNVAALLAFFLGGLGIHDFYMGRTTKGILMLVFCWTFIPMMIATVEALWLVLMKEERFHDLCK